MKKYLEKAESEYIAKMSVHTFNDAQNNIDILILEYKYPIAILIYYLLCLFYSYTDNFWPIYLTWLVAQPYIYSVRYQGHCYALEMEVNVH